MPDTPAIDDFIRRWAEASGSERANYQLFVHDLCRLLELPPPDPALDDTRDNAYVFERRVTFAHGDGGTSVGFIDCYKRGAFVLEAKKVKAAAATKGFDDALMRARAQAEGYARALPAAEGRPPFLVVVDVGHVIELYSEFTRSGATYTPFPDARSHRLKLADLRDAATRERLRTLWLDPLALDPARASAKVTREVAAQLAALARSLEATGHGAEQVAAFLTRCLFSMFAEDVGLLPRNAEGEGAFVALLRKYRDDPHTLRQMLAVLWTDMDRGGFSAALAKDVLRFNGKLFKGWQTPDYVLPLGRDQIDGLLAAAASNWREVEPAIFGTLLERALDPAERHALGAHYTPRAYVERLVLPTVVEPLRADWADTQAAALLLANEANALEGKKREDKLAEARAEIRRFHHALCTTRVLDPACGSGNFLYVTLEHLKRLEGEVLAQLEALGESQGKLGLEGETVTLQQLRGIEINERAAALAELVLWIGYLQWHIRTFGHTSVAEPVIHDYGNIEHRDAVLAWDRQEPMRDAAGQLVTRWDGVTFKTHPATGEPVPDETALVPQWRYVSPRPAEWPQADFIVGNPPFIGNKRMREARGSTCLQQHDLFRTLPLPLRRHRPHPRPRRAHPHPRRAARRAPQGAPGGACRPHADRHVQRARQAARRRAADGEGEGDPRAWHGLVAVPRSLHDELDAAVLEAYGWSDLAPELADHRPAAAEARAAAVETLLERLVALNAKRAAEEAAGTVRWLRPELQTRAGAGEQTTIDVEPEEVPEQAPEGGVARVPAPATISAVPNRPWPSGLPDQIKAVAAVLAGAGRALTITELEARFTARGRWRDRLPTILDTLEALGRARRPEAARDAWLGA